MPEAMTTTEERKIQSFRHRGRRSQIPIYLGKFLRMFFYQNDWKVLPMAAVIAGLVGMVTRNMFFITMEGTLMSALALTCVAIWNGCFNSIQVICRERDVIKREHRSGMHISAYVIAHLLYQALLCFLQTCITMYVCSLVGIKFPAEGLFTRWMIVDIGITVFLITYAADTIALWVSSLARNTTTAMTVMPFVLIFQLVFSGAMLTLPAWSQPLTNLTISSYGVTAITAQADYNNRPLVSLWSYVTRMKDTELSATVTLGQVIDYLADENNPGARDLRDIEFSSRMTMDELAEQLEASGLPRELIEGSELSDLLPPAQEELFNVSFTLGEIVDEMAKKPEAMKDRDREITVSTTVGEIIDYYGENKVHWEVQQKVTAASYNPKYENNWENIASCWAALVISILVCACLTTITLEFIDKDKR